MTNSAPINDWYLRINGHEHGVPHVHVIFRDGSRVSLAIETGEVLAGDVRPKKRLAEVIAHVHDHAAACLAEYRRLNP